MIDWAYLLLSLAALGFSIWQSILTLDHFKDGDISSKIKYLDGNEDYRISETGMFVFSQITALAGGFLSRNSYWFEKTFILFWVTELAAFVGFSYGGTTQDARATAAISAALSAFCVGVGYSWKLFSKREEIKYVSIDLKESFGKSLFKILPYLYIGLSVLFLNDIIILDELGIVDRQVDSDYDEIVLLADQQHIMMFVASQIALFVLGYFHKKGTNKIVGFIAALIWLVIFILEFVLVGEYTTIEDVKTTQYIRIYTANASLHVLFSGLVSFLVSQAIEEANNCETEIEMGPIQKFSQESRV